MALVTTVALVATVAFLVSRVTKICDEEDISIIDGNDVVKCMVGVDCVDCVGVVRFVCGVSQ